jgi:hypothetical protein
MEESSPHPRSKKVKPHNTEEYYQSGFRKTVNISCLSQTANRHAQVKNDRESNSGAKG